MSINAVSYVTSESINARAYVVNEQPSSFSVLLVKLEGTVLMDTLLGTDVTVLVVSTEFRYEIGSPSFGTKLVDTIEAIYRKKGKSSVATIEAFLGRFPI